MGKLITDQPRDIFKPIPTGFDQQHKCQYHLVGCILLSGATDRLVFFSIGNDTVDTNTKMVEVSKFVSAIHIRSSFLANILSIPQQINS